MARQIVALAGGVGGAKLGLGLAQILPPESLTLVINTGDDESFHGLHVSPDLDTVMYTLAHLANPETGWGIAGDTFNALARLGQYGGPTWFNLGDSDLATHIQRTLWLRNGQTLSQVTQNLCQALGIRHAIVPMSDEYVRTIAVTEEGEMSFQVYFVQNKTKPRLQSIRLDGLVQAHMAPAFREAFDWADTIVFCPSNPIISIGPILALQGVRAAIADFKGQRIAVSPIVGGKALRGPTAKMLHELGESVSVVGIARRYQELCDILVIDNIDQSLATEIEAMGIAVAVTNIVMNTPEERTRLAETILDLSKPHAH